MLVSETKARAEMWCPFVRQRKNGVGYSGEAPAANRSENGLLIGLCVGSQCMAWRFGIMDEKRGYCGLAGNPSAPVE